MSEKDVTATANKTFEQTKEPIRHPEPEKISKAGITTEASLEWERQRPPPVLEPEPTPEDLSGWRTAVAKADREHQVMIDEKRQTFLNRFQKAKEDFQRTAAHHKGPERD